jgi:hypothetical protein
MLVFLFYKNGGNGGGNGGNVMGPAAIPGSSVGIMDLGMSIPKPNTFFTSDISDVLTNPHAPPLKDNMLISGMGVARHGGGGGGIPINVATSAAVNTSYRQVGILTRANASNQATSSSDPVIMPLMGKPLFTSRDKWLFYTISDKNNAMKLPIIIKGRNALSEIGVDNVYDGDTVYVQGYNETFRVTLYENSTPQYIPFL